MAQHELEFRGRLALFRMAHGGEALVRASGYLLREDGEARLYLVTLEEAVHDRRQRLAHVALARFAKEIGADALVPVDHGMSFVAGRVTAAHLDGGFVPARQPVGLASLVGRLALAP